MAKLAFIGLGVMGGQLAKHLANAGHQLTVYNRTRAKADAWVADYGGRAVDSPAEAARDVEAVISCVGNDDDLASITLG
ncbi:MAG: NAD(P)-dependent oxidoreductase, partial [Sphingomonadales bacterium]|nr:NAD(P)-dependent oxidoreductase [Sphingomonadales bacterium]